MEKDIGSEYTQELEPTVEMPAPQLAALVASSTPTRINWIGAAALVFMLAVAFVVGLTTNIYIQTAVTKRCFPSCQSPCKCTEGNCYCPTSTGVADAHNSDEDKNGTPEPGEE